jgi:pimeloyl-ACP methyl ester carboxylesterase
MDLRGFGRSPLPPGPYAHARDVIEALDRHGLESVALVGGSLGGRVVLEVALARPELVRALVLIAPGLPGHAWSEELRREWAEEEAALEAGNLDAAVEANLRTWVDGPRRRPEDVDPQVRALVAGMQRRAFEVQLAVEEDEEELLVSKISRSGWARSRRRRWSSSARRTSRTCTRSPTGSSANCLQRAGRRSPTPRTCRASSGRASSTSSCFRSCRR